MYFSMLFKISTLQQPATQANPRDFIASIPERLSAAYFRCVKNPADEAIQPNIPRKSVLQSSFKTNQVFRVIKVDANSLTQATLMELAELSFLV